MKKVTIALLTAMAAAHVCASPMTLTLSGTASGNLGGTGFSDKSFTWQISYDTDVFYSAWGSDNPVFTNLSASVISLQDVASPINVTREHGVWVYDTTHLYFAPIALSSGVPYVNMITVNDSGAPSWAGRTPYSQSGGIEALFNGFSGITTDQGLLTMDPGSIDSVVAVAVPEPATAGLFIGSGLVIAAYRKLKKSYGIDSRSAG